MLGAAPLGMLNKEREAEQHQAVLTSLLPPSLPGDAEWKNLAYGAPCIQLMRETTEHNSPFHIKIVIAEVESGKWKALVLVFPQPTLTPQLLATSYATMTSSTGLLRETFSCICACLSFKEYTFPSNH